MSDKVYLYEGKMYCNTDLSEVDERYEDDLCGLYIQLEKNHEVTSETVYHLEGVYDRDYSDFEELIEEEFSDLVVNDAEELLKGDNDGADKTN